MAAPPWTGYGSTTTRQDPGAPHAHDLLLAAFAAVRNAAGQVLLVRCIDDGNWELPGGRIEVGETSRQAVVAEVAEESGITITLTTLSGVYSDPSRILVDPDGSIHQQLALCFHAVPADADAGQPRPDGTETDAVTWCDPARITELTMHPAVRLRLHNALMAHHSLRVVRHRAARCNPARPPRQPHRAAWSQRCVPQPGRVDAVAVGALAVEPFYAEARSRACDQPRRSTRHPAGPGLRHVFGTVVG
jgi:8-oxo-dGTP pyrophosphatase MutT (NUDIX family)